MGIWRSLFIGVVVLMAMQSSEANLSPHFYHRACPNVQNIVRQVVMKKISETVVTIPATLRLFFHDCFVEGCDASVLISTREHDSEKDAPDNMSLAGDGFDTVLRAKKAVEEQCPGVVSCADILTIATRDVVALSGGPNFTVELGRRDGRISKANRVDGNLPAPDFSLDKLIKIFAKNNLTMFDMVTLSGAHTVGFAHCSRFADRLYYFSSSSPLDPSFNPIYAQQLMNACPRNVGPTIAVNMDPVTPVTFDNIYYANLVNGLGLFASDEALVADVRSRGIVKEFAANQSSFFSAFAAAMVKLGRLGVKTGVHGEIRRDCSAFN